LAYARHAGWTAAAALLASTAMLIGSLLVGLVCL
jgi:hypothetical protein